jgi:tRNA pseudouridine65 synthase
VKSFPDNIPVIYRDDELLVVDKPSGMLVHRGWGRDSVVLTDIVRDSLGVETVHPVHRLDRGTSGVVLFALGSQIAQRVQEAFASGLVKKRYYALVRGCPPEAGHIDHPIPRREDGPRVEASTDFVCLASAPTEPRHVSLVEARPRTGRLHQVRRHLKHISHPIIGDANYGKGPLNRALAERYGLKRLALHAFALEIEHPGSGLPLSFEAALPFDLAQPFEKMGIEIPAGHDAE